jgi:uncharacterized protein (DUF2336 family)
MTMTPTEGAAPKGAMLDSSVVQRLIEDPSAAGRSQVALRMGAALDEKLNPTERALAEQILVLLARDAEVQVRASLAQSIKNSPSVPRKVALKLAQDVEKVSFPILRFSQSLTEEDLIAIVNEIGDPGREQVAQRAVVSRRLSATLIEMGDEATVTRLMRNHGADVDDDSLDHALDKFGGQHAVAEAMAYRPSIPLNIARRLVSLVADEIKQQILKTQPGAAEAVDAINMSGGKVLKRLTGEGEAKDDVGTTVLRLHKDGKLTSPVILRALVHGDVVFFEASLAISGGVPLLSARRLAHDPNPQAFAAIYTKAGFPKEEMVLFRLALTVAKETAYGGLSFEERKKKLLERLMTTKLPPNLAADMGAMLTTLEAL